MAERRNVFRSSVPPAPPGWRAWEPRLAEERKEWARDASSSSVHPTNRSLLDDRAAEILTWYQGGVTQAEISRRLSCSPTTVYKWLKKRGALRPLSVQRRTDRAGETDFVAAVAEFRSGRRAPDA